MVKFNTVKTSTKKNTKTTSKATPKTKTTIKNDNKQTIKKTTPQTTEQNKTRHFYVYYGKDNEGKDFKLEHARLSGKRPKQAAQKALSSIIKYEKTKGNDIIGKDIKFYIVETGRKKYTTKNNKKVPINKRKFYYIGKKVRIPSDLNDKYYNDKKIIKVDLERDIKGKITKINKEILIKDGKGREIRTILTNDNKVDAILISKKETTKKTKDGKEVIIPATYVVYQYRTEMMRDKDIPKEKPKKEIKTTKTTKSSEKKNTTKKSTNKKTLSKKSQEKKPIKKSSTKKNTK